MGEFFSLEYVASFAPIKSVVHIGAHYAEERDEYHHYCAPGVIWVEAHPEYAAVMIDAVEPYEKQYGFEACLSSESGIESDFWTTADEYASSLLKPAIHQELHPHALINGKIRVTTKTFKDFWQELQDQNHPCLEYDYNFLVLDTQGSELYILQGMEDLIQMFDLICVEYSTCEFYEGVPQLSDLNVFLNTAGYTMVYPETPVMSGDALFVKKR